MVPEEQRFVLGIAYQAGPDPRIKRGVDGGRDYFSKEELERACWSYMRSGSPQMNAFHVDGTEDCAEPVESFIWRWADWDVGDGIVVKDGDWCLGAILSPRMWGLYKDGKINGLSPEGTARRRRVQKEGAVTLAKGSADMADDDDEFTELLDADIGKVALVGRGANGVPRFLIAKREDGGAGLLDADYVRDLIGKSEPEPEPDREEKVTMTGSPAAMAKMIHQAAQRYAMTPSEVDERLAKAEMSGKAINDLPDSAFAYVEPGGKKDADGKTTPRSLRHFPIHDEAHTRNALARAPQSPFGDKAMPKIRSAAKRFGIEVSKAMELDDGVDGMDPTVVLAAPEGEAPGDPMDPGSPAWEAIDAATARKWTSIAVRLRNALSTLADRELLEAASGDPDDAESAWDLQDAECALDYVIDTLAGFAVEEQAEADLCGEAMAAVGKALASFDTAPLDTIEALGQVRKAGRVLSSANEAAIRGAVDQLQKVLASLPQAPTVSDDGQKVAKEEEKTTMADNDTQAAGTDVPETTPAATTQMGTPKQPASAAVPSARDVPAESVAKADGPKPEAVAVYDAKGNLVGICAPDDITPIAGAKPSSDGDGDAPPADGDGAAAPAAADLTPQPPADAGVPADAVPADDVEKTTEDPVAKAAELLAAGLDMDVLAAKIAALTGAQTPVAVEKTDGTETPNTEPTTETTDTQDVVKSIARELVEAALADHSAAQQQVIAKQAGDLEEQASVIKELKNRVEALENAPAVMAVMSNGAVPPAHLMRGQNNGQPAADLSQAQTLRKRLAESNDATEQKRLQDEMQQMAINRFQQMREQAAQRR